MLLTTGIARRGLGLMCVTAGRSIGLPRGRLDALLLLLLLLLRTLAGAGTPLAHLRRDGNRRHD